MFQWSLVKGEILNRERSSHVFPFPRPMTFRFSFLYKCPVFQFHDNHVVYRVGAVGREGLKMALGLCIWPLVIPKLQGLVCDEAWAQPEKVQRTSSVLRGPFDHRGPNVLQPFDSQRSPESWQLWSLDNLARDVNDQLLEHPAPYYSAYYWPPSCVCMWGSP